MGGSEGIVQDVQSDMARGMPEQRLSITEIDLIARLIISNGIEVVLSLGNDTEEDTAKIADLMSRLLIGGIQGLYADKI